MIGFGMPEMILIAVILGIVAVIIVVKKSGRQPRNQSDIHPTIMNNTSEIPQENVSQRAQPIQQPYNAKSMEIPGFGAYILALFFTPIYCITRKYWVGFVFSTILYILAAMTILFFGLGLIFWMLAAVPAAFKLRNEILVAHARRTGIETARAIAASQRGEL